MIEAYLSFENLEQSSMIRFTGEWIVIKNEDDTHIFRALPITNRDLERKIVRIEPVEVPF